MSGFAGALFPQPIQLGQAPPPGEGPKSVAININWQNVFNTTGAFVQPVNLLSQFQSGQFSTVQSVYVDNQTCPEMVTIVCSDTGQQIRVPPFAKGTYPVLCSQTPEFTITLNLAFDPVTGNAFSNCSTRLFFLNIAQPYFEAAPQDFGQNFNHYSSTLAFGGSTLTVPLGGSPGSGMIALGNRQNYAINSLSLSIIAGIAYSAATAVQVSLLEIGAQISILWTAVFEAPGGTTGDLFSEQTVFPTPVFQFQQQSYLALAFTAVPASANALFAAINLTYAIVTIA
jgi:hypothetical protein